MIGTCFNDSFAIFDTEPSSLTKEKTENIIKKISKETSDMLLKQLNNNLNNTKKNKSLKTR